MPNSNDVAGNEKLWERVLSLLVAGASVLGGSAVLLIQALPPNQLQESGVACRAMHAALGRDPRTKAGYVLPKNAAMKLQRIG